MIDKILQGATSLGACAKTDGIATAAELAALFFSPQGREFCLKNDYPTHEMWKEIKSTTGAEFLRDHDIWVDEGIITLTHPKRAAIIGDTRAEISIAGSDTLHRFIILKGASASIHAKNYAVFTTEMDALSAVSVSKDPTSRWL